MEEQGYTCPQCQSTNKAKANFCRACGFPRSDESIDCRPPSDATGCHCPECQRAVRGSDRFCMHCGHGLKTQFTVDPSTFCYRCSRQLPDSARYCYGCGLATTNPVPAPSEPSARLTDFQG
ncbi:MAG: zinc ribbon domain-containing protein [Candidatus Obscuribacterales bacterium]